MNGKRRLFSIEYLRAFSILYIVGFWHLFDYTHAFREYYNSFTRMAMIISMGLFVIISGFLVGSSAMKSVSLIHFYKNRLIRIYPLYALAVILLYAYGVNDAATSIKSLILISMYYGPAPVTLWFITMIMLFYLVTPLLLKLVESPVKYLLFIVAIFAMTVMAQAIFRTVDHRLVLYFSCYCIGIYCSRYGLRTRVVNIWSALLLLCLCLILPFVGIDIGALLRIIPIIFSSTYLIFAINYLNEDKFKRLNIVSTLSYCSFAMYLFHRPIYLTLKALYFPESGQFQVLYLMTVCLPAVVFISWGVQKLYDICYIEVNKFCGLG